MVVKLPLSRKPCWNKVESQPMKTLPAQASSGTLQWTCGYCEGSS